MEIEITKLPGGFFECMQVCSFSRQCACHYTAGEFRMEDGFTPELYKVDDDKIQCITGGYHNYKVDNENLHGYPANYNTLGRGIVSISKIPFLDGRDS